jgi:hypothetical protein
LRAALIAEIKPLIDKATPQKEARVMKAAKIDTEAGESWEQASDEQLAGVLKMLKC